MNISIGTLFSGIGGVDIGAVMAGGDPVWGVEIDANIVSHANSGGLKHIITGSVLEVDPSSMSRVDVIHASPPCPSFSQAKRKGKESDLDIALAAAVANFIKVIRPSIFTMENVVGYRKSDSYKTIVIQLLRDGYDVLSENVNMADYGVPQSRRRLIVVASRSGGSRLPTKSDRVVGWGSSISGLNLEESPLAPHQRKFIPDNMLDSDEMLFIPNGNTTGKDGVYYYTPDRPSNTITANYTSGRAVPRIYRRDGEWRVPERALARLQGFPDWFPVPSFRTPASVGIGNAVPPSFYAQLLSANAERKE